MRFEECTKCKGYGWVEGFEIVPTPNGPEEIPTRDECEFCEGEGEILSVKKYFRKVAEKFERLRVADMAGLSKVFEEFEYAFYDFEAELNDFLNDLKEE